MKRKACGRVRAMLRNQEDVEDVFQRSTIKAWLNLDRFGGNSGFETWFYTIVRNEAIDHIRAYREGYSGCGVNETQPCPHAAYRFKLVENYKLLDGLSPTLRERLNGAKYKDIASRGGRTVKALKALIARERQVLREKYTEQEPFVL